MLNYNKLKYFYTTAGYLNMTKAAEVLFLGQPALSVQIKELEQELGVSLFIRTNRGLVLTNAGNILYARIKPFFDDEQALIQDVKKAALKDKNTLRAAIVGMNLLYSFSEYVNEFNEKNNVNVTLKRMNEGPLTEALRNTKTDIGILFINDEIKNDQELGWQCFIRGIFTVAINKHDKLSNEESINISQLKDHEFALLNKRESPMAYYDTMQLCGQAGFTPKITQEYSSIEPLLTAVNIGEAITLTSSFAPVKGYDGIRCVRLENMPAVEVGMVWMRKNKNELLFRFIEYISSVFAGKAEI